MSHGITPEKDNQILDQQTVQALVRGSHVDTFSLLGMHSISDSEQRILVFLPGARSVSVVSPSGKTVIGRLQCLHPDGLFAAVLQCRKSPAYRLQVTYSHLTSLQEDPYRFPSLLDAADCYMFNEGTAERAYRFLGANHRTHDGTEGILFAVWAPNARRVSVVADFNHWDGRVHVMRRHLASGIWEIFVPSVEQGTPYKYEIIDQHQQLLPLKADPYAKSMQLHPDNASRVPSNQSYQWADQDWMASRASYNHCNRAISIYEVHAGSWRRNEQRGGGFLSYRELADQLIPYVQEMGFTHIQFMPLSEFPFDGSWGYQPLGMFAPTSRFGSADDLKFFIDSAHQRGIGVLLDWVPGHFPTDAHGLGQFDGTHLYEHADPRKGFHPDWSTLIYNYGRAEVCSYLISNVFYWLSEFHIDGLRFDAVASMLYLSYSRKDGEWLPNHHGGRENLEAIDLLRDINRRAYFNFPGIMTIAEESTAWPGVTNFIDQGGLGFGYKWNLGWMNDTLRYMSRDPIHRKFHHNELTFGLFYAFSENFILPLSHDEVVHGKRSIIERMPGDDWQKFAGLRSYYTFMWTHPGKKLLFMGAEIAQRVEWSHERSLDWHLLDYESHRQVRMLVSDLNRLYRGESALHAQEFSPACFEWVDADNHADSIFVYLRRDLASGECLMIVVNMTPIAHESLRFGVPQAGYYRELFNSNSDLYGGTGQGNFGGVHAVEQPSHGHPWSVIIQVPPLSALIFKHEDAQHAY